MKKRQINHSNCDHLCFSLFLLTLPLFGLLYGAMMEVSRKGFISLSLPSTRSFNLLMRSIVLSLIISVTSVFIGTITALGLYKKVAQSKRRTMAIIYLSFFMLLLPTFIHSYSWWKVFGMIGLPTRGIVPTLFVATMYYLPLPFILIFIALKSTDYQMLDAGVVFLTPNKLLFGVIMPALFPAIFGAGLIVFLLSLADYSIPSIFSVNVYALDIVAQFSVSGSISDTLFYSLPLMLVTVIVGIISFGLLKDISLTAKGEQGRKYVPIALENTVTVFSSLGLLIVLSSILVPCTALFLSIINSIDIKSQILMSVAEFRNTLIIALGSLLFALPISLSIGSQLKKRKQSWLVYFVLVTPLILPPALIGIGLIGVFKNTFLYNTLLLPILTSVIRFTPIGALLCYSGFKALDQGLLDARLVYQQSAVDGFVKILLPMFLPVVVMVTFIMFVLSIGEIGATIMVLPPGFNTIAIKIYNYLHYGASDTVAILCSVLAVVTSIGGGIVYMVVHLFRKVGD